MHGLLMERSLVEVVPCERGRDAGSEMSISQPVTLGMRVKYIEGEMGRGFVWIMEPRKVRGLLPAFKWAGWRSGRQ
jgi:hypothetical protein